MGKAVHTVIMNDREYRFMLDTIERLKRDSVFSEDAKKLGDIFRRDMPIPELQSPASGGLLK